MDGSRRELYKKYLTAQGSLISLVLHRREKIADLAVRSRRGEAAAMPTPAMGEWEKRERLREEGAARRRLAVFSYLFDSSDSEGKEEAWTASEERKKPARVKGKMARREGVKANKRRIKREDVKQRKGIDGRRKELSLLSFNRRTMGKREEPVARNRIERGDGVMLHVFQKQGKEQRMDRKHKELSLSSSSDRSSSSGSYGHVCSSTGSSCYGQANGDVDLASSLSSIQVPRRRRTIPAVS